MKLKTFYNALLGMALFCFPFSAIAQSSVGINTDTPNANAVLELVSPNNNQGLLVPIISTAERTKGNFTSTLGSNSSNNGLLVFDSDIKQFFYWETDSWTPLLSKDLSRILSMNNSAGDQIITGVADPVSATDAVNKAYVDDTIARIIMNIENIENTVNNHTTQLTEITDSIINYSEHFNEYWDSIVNYSENFTTLYDSIYKYDEHFNEYWDSIVNYSENFNEYWDSIVRHSENFTTLFDSIYKYDEHFNEYWDSIVNYSEHFNEYWDSITRIQKTFERAEFKLPNGQIYIGGTNDTAITVSISGDITLAGDGTASIEPTAVGDAELDKSNIPLSGFGIPQTDISMGDGTTNYLISNIADPVSDQDATSKYYVDQSLLTAKQSAKLTSDSLNYLYKTGKFSLSNGMLLIGNTADSAAPVSISGDISIDNTGDAQIVDNAIVATDIAGIADNGVAGQVLVTNTDGSFKWEGKFEGGLSDALTQDYFFFGDAGDKAQQIPKSNISLTGFAVPTSNFDLNNNAIINLSDPTAAQDAATKNYVDTELSAIDSDLSTREKELSDSINYIYTDGTIALPDGYVIIGGTNDSAKQVPLGGDILISNTTGTATIQDGTVNASNLDAGSGTGLANGTSGQVLTSDGAGNFGWYTLIDDDASNEIQDLSITGTELKITNNTAATTIDLSAIRLDQFSAPASSVSFNNQNLTDLATPSSDADAATKKYVDDSIAAVRTDLTALENNLNTANLTTNAVPVWDGSKLTNSSVWSNGTSIVIGGAEPAGAGAYSFDCEVVGNFKTQKIYHASDKRWKKEIQVLDSALLKVLQMEGVQYVWRQDEFPEKHFPDGLQIGLIAQQIEAIAPALVTTDAEGYKAVEYANLVAYLIEAVKAQQNIITDQEKNLKLLQEQNSKFDARLQKIESQLGTK